MTQGFGGAFLAIAVAASAYSPITTIAAFTTVAITISTPAEAQSWRDRGGASDRNYQREWRGQGNSGG
jgi:hypothetical protein